MRRTTNTRSNRLGSSPYQRTRPSTLSIKGAANKATTIIIKNLDPLVTREDVLAVFGKFGNIKKFIAGKGYYKLEYSSRAECQNAVNEYNGQIVDGFQLQVEIVEDVKANSFIGVAKTGTSGLEQPTSVEGKLYSDQYQETLKKPIIRTINNNLFQRLGGDLVRGNSNRNQGKQQQESSVFNRLGGTNNSVFNRLGENSSEDSTISSVFSRLGNGSNKNSSNSVLSRLGKKVNGNNGGENNNSSVFNRLGSKVEESNLRQIRKNVYITKS
ncbi:hypothetical protein HDU92_006157 [Lobulomyces angularis]|nr:hypothetical protein HDU92_006157 [Lobulomyces angularis]